MLRKLAEKLAQCETDEERELLLSGFSKVKEFLEIRSDVKAYIEKKSLKDRLILQGIIAAGQGDHLFVELHEEKISSLLEQLDPVQKFYESIGGIVGYQAKILELLSREISSPFSKSKFYSPEGIDISEETTDVKKAILDGIAHLPEMGEIYPLGGAGDRLRFYDERTGLPLPAARLPFLGKTLLEGLIADLQSREYLYYKLYGEIVTVPIAIMTSEEKNNHAHILEICQESSWFGRPPESFRFFCQPLVPTINREGTWFQQAPMQLLLKPGGHGTIWRLAEKEGIFEWFFSCGRKKALVRQVNNPVANTDYGLLAFTGIGCIEDKLFGFASCPRQVKASEGINVLIETRVSDGFSYTLTNIEYCDFKKFGIIDEPEKKGSRHSKFPSNTNILFVDLKEVQKAQEFCPIPGTLVNLKKIAYRDPQGQKKEEEIARLESTMQNIADFFGQIFSEKPETRKNLKTYLTYNHRRKTISAAKREFTLGSSLLETPEGCFFDILQNASDLLMNYCQIDVPAVVDLSQFFDKSPPFIFLYHPSLGPLYSIIGQKLKGGKIHPGSELQLQVAEVAIENLDLQGSLLIQAENIMGVPYSEKCGRCILKNVTIRNKGIDPDLPSVFWRNEISRKEVCQILLRGMSEFYAENVTLEKDQFIEVPDGESCRAIEVNGELEFIFEKIEKPSWYWHYTVHKQEIQLTKVTCV